MKAAEINFRKVYHKICFIKAGKSYEKMTKCLPNYKRGDGTLAYAYIDHEAGLTYEILACAEINENACLVPFPGNDAVTLKLRAGSVAENEIYVLKENPQLIQMYQNKIDEINKAYWCGEEIEETRKIEVIDESRSHEYPDDVLVILFHGKNNPEGCWVCCEKVADGMMVGKLLNEPDADFTVHQGDMISFGIAQQEGRIICVASF